MESAQIPFPVLLLRNSFLLLKKEQAAKLEKLGFTHADLFTDELSLLNILVKRESEHQLSLDNELQQVHDLYAHLKRTAADVDSTLQEHVAALEAQVIKKLTGLEKKLLRAERAKFETLQKQISKLKQNLFPGNSLQEREDNFSLYYAKYGKAWLQTIYHVSRGLEAGFGMVII